MDIEKKLDELKKIKRVEAPPFLITRIHARLNNLSAEKVPTAWRWAFATAAAVLLTLNIGIMNGYNSTSKQAVVESIAAGMELSTSNDLYE